VHVNKKLEHLFIFFSHLVSFDIGKCDIMEAKCDCCFMLTNFSFLCASRHMIWIAY